MSLSPYTPAALGLPHPRAHIAPPGYRSTPVLVLEGVAQDATSAGLRRRAGRALQYVRVGPAERSLSHEFEPGWPIALKLEPGTAYRCEAFECELPENVRVDTLPLDAPLPEGIVFHHVARELGRRKDTADARRVLRDLVAVWTDGLMLQSTKAAGELVAGRAYRVEVRVLSSA